MLFSVHLNCNGSEKMENCTLKIGSSVCTVYNTFIAVFFPHNILGVEEEIEKKNRSESH